MLPSAPPRFLAIESSTDRLSVALGTGSADDPVWSHTGAGGAQASRDLLPAVQRLLQEAGWALTDLTAIAFGRGPGAFTGLRTACAVAQGLAYGARDDHRPHGLPVLPIDTLLALAEAARAAQERAGPLRAVAALDARMDELYVAAYDHDGAGWTPVAPARLCAPDDFGGWLRGATVAADAGTLLAGNAWTAYGARLGTLPAPGVDALPDAAALLRLAPRHWALGEAVPAAAALPLYVRDQVARTTAEREALAALPPQAAASEAAR